MADLDRDGRRCCTTLCGVSGDEPIRDLGRDGFLDDADALIEVYQRAMRPGPEMLAGRKSVMKLHTSYPGFRALAARSCDPSGEPVAFCYGFHGVPGQWWHDVVRSALSATAGRQVGDDWLADCMEIAELHVRPDYQRRGIGTRLLLAMTSGRAERTAVLSTQDRDSPARRLYRRMGFTDLLTGFYFPGGGPPYAVMGARLPLGPAVAVLPPLPAAPRHRGVARVAGKSRWWRASR